MGNNEIVVQEKPGTQMKVVSRHDVEALKNQRSLLREFVSSQLVEAQFTDPKAANYGEGDYGIIPGTKKRGLLKPGAEKLQRLFQMGCRFRLVDKVIEREMNFAMFIYKAEVYLLKNPDVVIAECDASVNSQEVKYKERTAWKNIYDKNGKKLRSEQTREETPIFDVMNTLIKMAQKRAMIGATILATGASEYFTQDMLDEEDLKSEPSTQAPSESSSERDATPQAEASQAAPQCCGKTMMISKYGNRDGERKGKKDWYCLQCKTSQPREPQ